MIAKPGTTVDITPRVRGTPSEDIEEIVVVGDKPYERELSTKFGKGKLIFEPVYSVK